MSKLDKVHLVVSPLTENVYIARFGKDPELALETKDAMNEFLHAIVKFVGVGGSRQFGGGDEQFVVSLRAAEPGEVDSGAVDD